MHFSTDVIVISNLYQTLAHTASTISYTTREELTPYLGSSTVMVCKSLGINEAEEEQELILCSTHDGTYLLRMAQWKWLTR